MTPRPANHSREVPDYTQVQANPSPTMDSSVETTNPTFGTISLPGGVPGYPFLSPPQAADELGRLGDYRILKLLGEGGMGFVFRAEDPTLRRLVALKVMRPEIAKKDNAADRFLREGRAAAGLKSDHIITIYEADQANGVPYLAMEFLEGLPVDVWFKQQKKAIPITHVLRIAKDVLRGLAAAHEKGLIHRDIKPANLWIEKGTLRTKVLDFGLTRSQDSSDQMTADGAVVGTPAFMAPEQAGGKPIDTRADLFSVGTIMYLLLAGKNPFTRDSLLGTLGAVTFEVQPPVTTVRPDVQKEYSDFLDRLLAKDAAGRPANAKAALVELVGIEKKLVDVMKTATSSASVPMIAMPIIESGPKEWGALTEDEGIKVRTNSSERTRSFRSADADSPRKPPSKKLLLGGGLFAFLAVLGGIIIIITNKDGTKKTIEVPDDAKVEIVGKPIQPEPKRTNPQSSGPQMPAFKNSIGMEFVKVPKGSGWLGGGADKPGETKVEFKEDFYLGKYEVTQGEWEAVMGANPSNFSRNGAGKDAVKDIPDTDLKRFPVDEVSWDECQLFVKKLNEKEKETGWVYRLPKEAEWEFACRGGPVDKLDSAFEYYFAKPTNTLRPEQANFNKTLERTCKVGSFEPNSLGLYDIHGNLWEWCEDTVTRDDGVSRRAIRGGSWTDVPMHCGVAPTLHFGFPPSYLYRNLGLRLARVPNNLTTKAAGTVPTPERAVSLVESLAGKVIRDEKSPGKPVIEVSLENTKVTDAGIKELASLTNLKNLNLNGCTHVTDVGIKELAPLTNLNKLYLDSTQVTDVGIKELAPLKSLTDLVVSRTAVTDAGIKELAPLTNLTSIMLWGTQVTDAGIKKLAALKSLRHLDLNGCTQVTDAGIKALAPLTNLDHLNIGVTQVTDAGIKELAPFKNLSTLILWNTPVTDTGLETLKALKNLKQLHINGTKVTAEGVKTLKAALPECQVMSDFDEKK